eukprot:CAMPEP_0115368060 /NCGR_PEP_ID=MMETSP0270-20121206/105627_1 /TAXON_ID=71861 /ORGANISM="Scrippsiella trochoidea, Strain CCMP3099" /LENGTH=275 /DNA_ID=CAMNT_0002790853 /DNA_START=118 /DNA_END=943 /DNA_ORIENTATION=+
MDLHSSRRPPLPPEFKVEGRPKPKVSPLSAPGRLLPSRFEDKVPPVLLMTHREVGSGINSNGECSSLGIYATGENSAPLAAASTSFMPPANLWEEEEDEEEEVNPLKRSWAESPQGQFVALGLDAQCSLESMLEIAQQPLELSANQLPTVQMAPILQTALMRAPALALWEDSDADEEGEDPESVLWPIEKRLHISVFPQESPALSALAAGRREGFSTKIHAIKQPPKFAPPQPSAGPSLVCQVERGFPCSTGFAAASEFLLGALRIHRLPGWLDL